jgi:hypothetical protein
MVTGKREATTVPTQSLFLLNSTFVRKLSLALAERLLAQDSDDATRIEQAHLLTLGRKPSCLEIARATQFIEEFERSSPEIAVAVAETPRVAEEKVASEAEDDVVANPDDVPRDDDIPEEAPVLAGDARTAAWMNFVQALYASAEFRFVR